LPNANYPQQITKTRYGSEIGQKKTPIMANESGVLTAITLIFASLQTNRLSASPLGARLTDDRGKKR
jgi:hypothetical protein